MKEVAETAHLFLDNKFAYSGAAKPDTTFMIDWCLFLGDLYKYKRFKLCLNGFNCWTNAQTVSGFDQRATVRLKGLNWCAGNSSGVYNALTNTGNYLIGLQLNYADAEAIVPSMVLLPLNGPNSIVYNDSNGLCFHRPEPGPKPFNITFQDVRGNSVYPSYEADGTPVIYNISFIIIPLED